MKKMSFTLFRSSSWLSASFLVLFAWCLVGSVNAQTALDLSNDTRANGQNCDHAGTTFSGCSGTYTDDGAAGLYNDFLQGGDGFRGPFAWTFCPDASMDNRVRLTFSEFDVHLGDNFTVYNGPCGGEACTARDGIQLTGSSVGSMVPSAAVNASGTLIAGAGWIEATCSSITGCLTVEWTPNRDNNKGTGWTFDVSCSARAADIRSPRHPSADIMTKVTLPTCSDLASIVIPAPQYRNCAVAPEPYVVEVIHDGVSRGFFSQADFAAGVVTIQNIPAGEHWVDYILYYDPDGVCRGNNRDELVEKDVFGGSYTVQDAVDLVGNDNINVSIGDDCWTTITADDLLESHNGIALGAEGTITVTSKTGGTPILSGAPSLTPSVELQDVGTYTYVFRDVCNNAVTGTITMVDLQGPVCPGNETVFILCGETPDAVAPEFKDCNEVAETSHDDLVFGNCGNFTLAERTALFNFGYGETTWWTQVGPDAYQIPAVNGGTDLVESVIVRSWKAVDGLGNTTEGCLQIFVNVRPNELFAPTSANIQVNCGEGTSPDELLALTNPFGGPRFNPAAIAPNFVATVPGNFSPQTGSGATITRPGIVLPGDHSVCGWIADFTDEEIESCGEGRKIIRTWTWLDWCSANPTIQPVDVNGNPAPFTQVIEVVDNAEPELVSGPAAMERSVGHFDCTSDVTIGSAVWEDACGDVVSYRTELVRYRDGDFDGDVDKTDLLRERNAGNILWKNNSNGGSFADLELGTYWVLYFGTDECGNETSRITDRQDPVDWSVIPANVYCTTLTVLDDVAPQPQANDLINVSLGSDWGRITVADVDEGSYDNCWVGSMGISFSEEGPFTEELTLNCEDVHEELNVYLQVIDESGNSNISWGRVQVEDKLAPICVAPDDMTVDCDIAHISNIENGEVSGDAAAHLDALFGAVDCQDNVTCVDLGITQSVEVEGTGCGRYTITRTWTATDWNRTSAPVSQTVTVEYKPGWKITVPGDEEIFCTIGQESGSFSFGKEDVIVDGGSCDQLAVEVTSREFVANDDACRKVLVTYHIVNWCLYQPGDEAVVLPNDGSASTMFTSDDYATASSLTFTRVLKLNDNVAPDVKDIAHDGLCIDGADCTDSATWTAWADDCVAEDDMTWTAVVYETDAQGNILATVATANDYEITAPIENKKYYVAEFWAADGCGNSGGAKSDPERAWDCKQPTPYALNGLAISIMPTGMVAVWASDVDQGSFDNCGEVDIFIRKAGDGAPTTAAEAAALGTSVTFTCNDLGTQSVELYAVDGEGNYDFVSTYIIIQDNVNACQGQIEAGETGQVAGKITDADGASLETVDVSVNGGMASMATQNNGEYAFTLFTGEDYTITPEKNVNPLNGVSTFDLVLISKHILGIQTLDTPYKYIAADVNKSGSITAFDMVQLRQLILNITTEFPSNESWRFVDAAHTFGANPLTENFNEFVSINNLAGSVTNADFIAVKVGDVNGSAQPNSLTSATARNAKGTMNLTVVDQAVVAGQDVSVAFTSADVAAVAGYQFTMNYAGLELAQLVDGVATAENFNTNLRGALATSWNGVATANDVLFTLNFTATTSGNLSELLSVGSDAVVAEAYTAEGELLDVAINFTSTAAGFGLEQNTPNPFNAETVIGFNLPAAGTATLKVMDIQGKVLKSVTADYAKGYNQISLNAKELGATGVLHYQLESADNVATKKMIIIE